MKETIEQFIDDLIKIEYPRTGEHIVARAHYREIMHQLIPKYFVPNSQPQVTQARDAAQSESAKKLPAQP